MVKMYSSSERNHTICRHLFRKVCFRTQLTVKRLFGILTIATAFIIIQQRRENSAFPQWNEKLIHGRAEPQRTLHFPFRTGCPQDCGAYRHVESSRFGSIFNDEQNFYRVTVEWYFGNQKNICPLLIGKLKGILHRTSWVLIFNARNLSSAHSKPHLETSTTKPQNFCRLLANLLRYIRKDACTFHFPTCAA